MSQKKKDNIMKGLVYGSSFFTVGILVMILGFIFINGIPKINMNFLTSDYEDKTAYVNEIDGKYYDMAGEEWKMRETDIIDKKEVIDGVTRLRVTRPGGGILPMAVTTLYMILLSLAFAAPIGIMAAIYLNEYATQGKMVTLIRFAIQNLAGIPSIIYGLFGSLFFVQVCKMGYSVLAGALTLSILLLPTIISTTEETLKAIPMTYRESSLGLGATKLQTLTKVVLPNAISGIVVAIILSIGRIVGESAALLLTAGTVASIPGALTGDSAAGATLTIKAYTILKEEGDIGAACAIGVVLMIMIIILNFASKMISKRYGAKQGA